MRLYFPHLSATRSFCHALGTCSQLSGSVARRQGPLSELRIKVRGRSERTEGFRYDTGSAFRAAGS